MAEEKSLKIGVKVDDKNAKRLNASLLDTAKVAEKLQTTVKNLTGEFAKLDKELVNKVKDLKTFKDAIVETDKALQAMLNKLSGNKNVRAGMVNNIFGNMARGTQAGSNSSMSGTGMVPRYVQNQAQQASQPTIMNMASLGGSPTNPMFVAIVGGGGGGRRNDNDDTNTPEGRRNRMSQGMAVGGFQAIAGAANFVQDVLKTGQLNNLAQVQQGRGSMMRRLGGGDVSDLYFSERFKNQDTQANLTRNIDIASGQTAIKGGRMATAGANVAQAMAGINPENGGMGMPIVGGIRQLFKEAGGAITAEGTGQDFVTEMRKMEEAREASKMTRPEHQMMLEALQAQAGARMQAARATGGRGGIDMLAGYGYDPGEAAGFLSSLGGRVGATAMMGAGGQRGIAQTSANLEMRGLDRDAMGALSGGLYSSRLNVGKNEADRLRSANSELEKILKNAFVDGIKDAAIGQEVAEGVMRGIRGPGGSLLDPAELARILSQGGGTKADIESRQAGLDITGKSLTQNPLLQAIGMEKMKQIMGPDFDMNVGLALQRASPMELASGGSKELQALLGGGADGAAKAKELSKNYLKEGILSPAVKFLTQGTGASATKARSGLDAAGGDLGKFLSNPDNLSLMAGILGQVGVSGDFTQREGFLESARNLMQGDIASRGALPGKQGGVFLKQKSLGTRVQNQALSKLFEKDDQGNMPNLNAVNSSLDKSMSFFAQLQGMKPDQFTNYTEAAAILMKLVDHIAGKKDDLQETARKLMKKVDEQITKAEAKAGGKSKFQ